jgi:hypothetical protein
MSTFVAKSAFDITTLAILAAILITIASLLVWWKLNWSILESAVSLIPMEVIIWCATAWIVECGTTDCLIHLKWAKSLFQEDVIRNFFSINAFILIPWSAGLMFGMLLTHRSRV